MMRMNYKKIFSLGIIFLAVSYFATASAFGVNSGQGENSKGNSEGRPEKTEIQADRQEKICERFENSYGEIIANDRKRK